MNPRSFLTALCLFTALFPAGGWAEAKRFALVIGNAAYGENLALDNPGNDAEAMASALQALGFTVFKHKDLELERMEEALFQFAGQIDKETLAIFFFAGHGIQAGGVNYLIPINASFRAEYELKHKAFSANMVLEALEQAGVPLKVLVLDCCRDNPLARGWKSRSTAANGLATMAESQGTIIAYSTGPGEVADDGKGANSPYTAALTDVLKSRPKEGLELFEVFRTASREVKTRTGQIPWVNADATIAKYYLVDGDGSVPAPSSMSGQVVDGLPDRKLNELQEQIGKLEKMLADSQRTKQNEAAAGPVNEELLAMLKQLIEEKQAKETVPAPAPAPVPAMARSGAPFDEEALKRFIVGFDESGEVNDPGATSRFYASEVEQFFDKYGLTRAEIREGREDYIEKFPYRLYDAQRYEIVGSNDSVVTVQYSSRYSIQSQTGRRLSGTAHTTMKMRILSPTEFEIYSIGQTLNKD